VILIFDSSKIRLVHYCISAGERTLGTPEDFTTFGSAQAIERVHQNGNGVGFDTNFVSQFPAPKARLA
jgi:hypothetical protein